MTARKSFPDRPLFLAAIGFCSGLILARGILGKSAWVLAAILIVFGLILIFIKLKRAAIVFIMCAIGLMRLNLAYPVLPSPADECLITGRICDTPVRTGTGWRMTLDKVTRGTKPVDGKLALSVSDMASIHEPEYGQTILATAALSLPQGARNEGGMDARFYYFTKGVSCSAYCTDEQISFTAGEMDLYGRLLEFRESTTSILISLIGRENGSLAACMLHGDSSEIPAETLDDFRGSGVAHLLAVSGLHVSLIAGVLIALLRRTKPLPRLLITALFLLFYSAFTAFSPSTVRAGVMTLCMLAGDSLSRPNDPLTSLSFSFLILTVISPFSVFMTGFQLSYTAVLGILLLYPVLKSALKSLPHSISSAIGVSLSGQVATFPVTAAYFGRLPLFSVFANMLIVPLAPLVILPAGIALLAYPFSGAIAGVIAGVADDTLILMHSVASLVAGMGAFFASAPSFFACVLYFLSMLFISKNHLAPLRAKLTLCVGCAVLCLIVWSAPGFTRPSMYVDALDMRYGYAAYLHSPTESIVVCDEQSAQSDTLSAYLRSSGIRSYTVLYTQQGGAHVMLGSEEIFIGPEFVEVRGVKYGTAQNGRIRIRLHNGEPVLSSYARDKIYDILIEQKGVFA